MKFTHTDAGGNTYTIREMEDRHLMNTIRMILNKVSMTRKKLDGKQDDMPASQRALYGGKKESEETLAQQMVQYTTQLSSYLFEAVIRGYNLTSEMRTAYGIDDTKAIAATIVDDSGIT